MYNIKLKRQILFDYFCNQISVKKILLKLTVDKPSRRSIYYWIKSHNNHINKLQEIKNMELKNKKVKVLKPREGFESLEAELIEMRKYYDIRMAELNVEKDLKKK